ncbi:DUF551 domain-containing protein [Mesorhizobium sp. M8A.F.Ca.ET.173.01.1.1]|nr:DUF551 domain-containing protein [Mesorhizobium sp. M8A.F.Ca.ET.173.01.1.1]
MTAPDANGWMPIETAPFDNYKDAIITGTYPNGIPYVEVSFRYADGHWNGRRYDQPTHWQPLPKPPVSP